MKQVLIAISVLISGQVAASSCDIYLYPQQVDYISYEADEGKVSTRGLQNLEKAGYQWHIIENQTGQKTKLFISKLCTTYLKLFKNCKYTVRIGKPIDKSIQFSNAIEADSVDTALEKIDTCSEY